MSDAKDDILEAATKLFLQRSYDAVSIKDITEAVGVTKGALYHHFSSKEELLGEVIAGNSGSTPNLVGRAVFS